MSNSIDPEKLKAAREKLACHIEPPKGSAYAEALAKSGVDISGSDFSASGIQTESIDTCDTGSSCGAPSLNNKAGGKIRLTEMTTAGG